MDFRYLYTSFDGRLNRKPFWIASLIMMAAAIVIALIVVAPFAIVSPGAGAFVSLILTLALLYPVLALGVKRLHDRGKSGQLMAVFIAPSLILQLGELFGLTGTEQLVAGEAIYLPNALGWLLNLVNLGVGIWALIELGVLKGTEGANEYGPDPVSGKAEGFAVE